MNATWRAIISALLTLSTWLGEPAAAGSRVETALPFSGEVLTTGLQFPWEITFGPDRFLWLTERTGKRVTRVDPQTGEKRTAIELEDIAVGPQQGLLGMALHPELLRGSGHDFVYLTYTYAESGPEAVRRMKIVRLSYDPASQTLKNPQEIMAGIPAGTDHNGGRLAFGPDGMLYLTTGDQGHNQSANFCRPNRAQELPSAAQIAARNWSSYTGKILRLTPEGGIPADNPRIAGVQSHIFSYGHRNPQGIAFGPDGKVYSSEHGPNSDDEINLIEAGGNYGWPHVAGYRDDQAYVYRNWSAAPNCESLTYNGFKSPDSVPQTKETEWFSPDFREPIVTMYTVPSRHNFADPACKGNDYICWPSIAPSGTAFYPPDAPVLRWRNSLLVTALKHGALYRYKLTDDGGSVKDAEQLFVTVNRYRDLAIGPDGKTVFIVTDSEGDARDAEGGATDKLDNPGAILVFRYRGPDP